MLHEKKVCQYKNYVTNALNQYASVDDFVPVYDADGNATQIKTATGTWTISYNGANRPVFWENAQTGEKIYMMFDALGRRFEKRVLNAAGKRILRERYVYVGYTCVQVLNGDNGNAVEKEFVWDPTETVSTRPLTWFFAKHGLNLFYAHDGNKNVSDVFFLAVQNGVAAHYEYAPFGTITYTAKNTPYATDLIAANPFRFSSEFYDTELDLIYYNYRHYSPALGRFLSRDPIEEQCGLNLYAFVGNSPTCRNDIRGLWSFTECIKRCLGFKSTSEDISDYSLSMGVAHLGAECIRFRNRYISECLVKPGNRSYCKQLRANWKQVCDMAYEASKIVIEK